MQIRIQNDQKEIDELRSINTNITDDAIQNLLLYKKLQKCTSLEVFELKLSQEQMILFARVISKLPSLTYVSIEYKNIDKTAEEVAKKLAESSSIELITLADKGPSIAKTLQLDKIFKETRQTRLELAKEALTSQVTSTSESKEEQKLFKSNQENLAKIEALKFALIEERSKIATLLQEKADIEARALKTIEGLKEEKLKTALTEERLVEMMLNTIKIISNVMEPELPFADAVILESNDIDTGPIPVISGVLDDQYAVESSSIAEDQELFGEDAFKNDLD